MKYALTQSFYFEAAHTLDRAHETDSSRRIHGHTYQVAVTVSGPPRPETGMVVDLAVLRAAVAEVRERLDHRLLDDVPGLGRPTLENLCSFVFEAMAREAWVVERVEVARPASGDACALSR